MAIEQDGRSPSGRATHERSQSPLSPPAVGVPNADCAECERLREEIADYLGHRTDSIAGKMWAARHLFSRFESKLEDLLGDFDGLGHDEYDQSLEIYGVPETVRLGIEAQQLIHDAGFGRVYVNHGARKEKGRWETHYTFHDKDLPVRGWRRRYVSDPTADTTRVIAGPKDNGYYEVSYLPESWNNARIQADVERGYYRIVPDPLDPFTASGTLTEGGDVEQAPGESLSGPVAKPDAQPQSKASE